MDTRTVAAYEAAAEAYCDEWLSQPPPLDLQALWRRYFAAGESSIDIGAGSGRDVDWLNRHGYPCQGVDASPALVAAARSRFPAWRFELAALPPLAGIAAGAYRNVVCETVIMHLPASRVAEAVRSLRGLLAAQGTLYLSWRVGSGRDTRDAAGRLYSHFACEIVREGLRGLENLHDAEEVSASSGRRVHRLVVRRAA
jgi:2-polyprenyl-3-methyl-5-hydroxy-6-metoxy-1,4-benzoquinol methylase